MKEEQNTISAEEREAYEQALHKIRELHAQIRALQWIRGMISEEVARVAAEMMDQSNWMGLQGWKIGKGEWPLRPLKVPKSGE